MTDTADAMSVENGTAISIRVFNTTEYRQSDLFVRIEQIEDSDSPLRDASSSHVTLPRASFRIYG